jgi:hypothetical protein
MHELQNLNAIQSRGIVHRAAVFHRSGHVHLYWLTQHDDYFFPSATERNGSSSHRQHNLLCLSRISAEFSRFDDTNLRYSHPYSDERIYEIDSLSLVSCWFAAMAIAAIPAFHNRFRVCYCFSTREEGTEPSTSIFSSSNQCSLVFIQLEPAEIVANYLADCHFKSSGKVLLTHTPL